MLDRTSFAVAPRAMRRRTAVTPKSAGWTLYDPKPLADRLGLSVEEIDRALEETGFNKAVRIREEIIRWKERLRHEERDLVSDLADLHKRRSVITLRLSRVREQLESVRNILRLPRERP